MNRNRDALLQVVRVGVGIAVLSGVMLAVYALIGKLNTAVVLGAVFGTVASIVYFFALTVTVSLAADDTEAGGDPNRAVLRVRAGSVLRLGALAVLYFLVLKFSTLDPVAAVLPLLFVRVSIYLTEFFRREK